MTSTGAQGGTSRRSSPRPACRIAFEACVENVKFSVGYDPLHGAACLFVYCVFGVVPLTSDAAMLRGLLASNISMAQQLDAAYCIDEQTQELACYMRTTMDIDAQTLRMQLRADRGTGASVAARRPCGGNAKFFGVAKRRKAATLDCARLSGQRFQFPLQAQRAC